MNNKKGGNTALLEKEDQKTKDQDFQASRPVAQQAEQSSVQKNVTQDRGDKKLEAREERTEQLIHSMENRMKQAARDFKGSENEARELSHDMAGRIKRISQTAGTDDAFERQVEEAVAAALRYFVNKSRTEAKKEEKKKNKEEEAKKKEEEEKSYIRHGIEKPDLVTKGAPIAEKKSETVNTLSSITDAPKKDIKANPLIGTPLNKPVQSSAPKVENKPESTAKTEVKPENELDELAAPIGVVHTPESFRTQMVSAIADPEGELKRRLEALKKRLLDKYITHKSVTGKIKRVITSKKDEGAPKETETKQDEHEKVHNAIAHAIQNPVDPKDKHALHTPESFRSQMTDAIVDPEEALKRRLEALKKRLINKYIYHKSVTGRVRRAIVNKKDTPADATKKAVPLENILGSAKKKPNIPIASSASPNEELAETITEYEVIDRGSSVVGNPRIPSLSKGNNDYTDIQTFYSPPRNTQNNQPQAKPQIAQSEGGESGRKKKNRKKGAIANYEERLAAQAGKQLVLRVVQSPYFWIVMIVLYIIILVIGIIVGTHDQQDNNTTIPVTISKTGPAKGSIGQNLDYSIVVGYAGQATDVSIVDKLPPNTKYISSNPAGVYDATAQTVTWQASALKIALANPVNMTVGITLQATANNVFITNVATATVIAAAAPGGSGGAPNPNWTAPVANNCGGKYSLINPLKMNFGDTGCNFNKNDLYSQLKTEDPANADVWFNKIITCESGYNPNAYAGPNTGTPDAAGAWGLFQMGSSAPPGSAPPAPGKNGLYDRGDVPWSIQVTNATTYGKKIGNLKAYWACAR
jgi:hypothetical protein